MSNDTSSSLLSNDLTRLAIGTPIHERVPYAELQHMRDAGATGSDDKLYSIIEFSRSVVMCCHTCLNRPTTGKLYYCVKCHLTWYCNEECRKKDEKQHAKWCCQKNGPADPVNGPWSMRRLG